MPFNTYEETTLEALVTQLETSARIRSDGHITIMKFTGGWKAFLGTPDLSMEGRDQVGDQIRFGDLRSAVVSLLNNPDNRV